MLAIAAVFICLLFLVLPALLLDQIDPDSTDIALLKDTLRKQLQDPALAAFSSLLDAIAIVPASNTNSGGSGMALQVRVPPMVASMLFPAGVTGTVYEHAPEEMQSQGHQTQTNTQTRISQSQALAQTQVQTRNAVGNTRANSNATTINKNPMYNTQNANADNNVVLVNTRGRSAVTVYSNPAFQPIDSDTIHEVIRRFVPRGISSVDVIDRIAEVRRMQYRLTYKYLVDGTFVVTYVPLVRPAAASAVNVNMASSGGCGCVGAQKARRCRQGNAGTKKGLATKGKAPAAKAEPKFGTKRPTKAKPRSKSTKTK